MKIQRVGRLEAWAEPVLGFELERPAEGGKWAGPSLEVSGIATTEERPLALEIRHADHLLRQLRVEPAMQTRWDQRRLRGRSWRFIGTLTTLGLPLEARLDLELVFEGRKRVPVATVEVSRALVTTGYESTLSPVAVTSLPGMGASRVMALLAVHPQVVAVRRVPYDGRTAAFWLRAVMTMAQPEIDSEGAAPDLIREPSPGAGLFVERAAELCQRNIDDWYQGLARDQIKSAVRYFAEKLAPRSVQRVLRELYPNTREVVVVRDPRDWIVSLATQSAPGIQGVPGYLRPRDGEEASAFVERVAGSVVELWADWEARRSQVHLLRFEDLVQDPAAALLSLLGALDLDADPVGVRALIEEARMELRSHPRSSVAPPGEGIGRWRRDLSPGAARLARELLAEPLAAFGYERAVAPRVLRGLEAEVEEGPRVEV